MFIQKLQQLQRRPVTVGNISIESEKRMSARIRQIVQPLIRPLHPPNKSLSGKTLFDDKLIDLGTSVFETKKISGARQSRHIILLSHNLEISDNLVRSLG